MRLGQCVAASALVARRAGGDVQLLHHRHDAREALLVPGHDEAAAGARRDRGLRRLHGAREHLGRAEAAPAVDARAHDDLATHRGEDLPGHEHRTLPRRGEGDVVRKRAGRAAQRLRRTEAQRRRCGGGVGARHAHAGPRVRPFAVPGRVEAPRRVEGDRGAAVRTRLEGPAVLGDAHRRCEARAAVGREGEHGIADATREDLPPGERHAATRPCRRRHAAAHAGVAREAGLAGGSPAGRRDAREPGGVAAAALAAVDPRDEGGAVAQGGHALERVGERAVLVHAHGRLEAPRAVPRARETEIRGEEDARRLRLRGRPGGDDVAVRGHREARRLVHGVGRQPLRIETHGRRLAAVEARHPDVSALVPRPGESEERRAVGQEREARRREVERVGHTRVDELAPQAGLEIARRRGRRAARGGDVQRDQERQRRAPRALPGPHRQRHERPAVTARPAPGSKERPSAESTTTAETYLRFVRLRTAAKTPRPERSWSQPARRFHST